MAYGVSNTRTHASVPGNSRAMLIHVARCLVQMNTAVPVPPLLNSPRIEVRPVDAHREALAETRARGRLDALPAAEVVLVASPEARDVLLEGVGEGGLRRAYA